MGLKSRDALTKETGPVGKGQRLVRHVPILINKEKKK